MKNPIDLVEKAFKILQALAIIIGIWATFNAYQQQNHDRAQQERIRNEQTAKEYRKHFYQKQLDFYIEATEATAILSTEKYLSQEYIAARKVFYRLFWGKLSIVEEKQVEASMIDFKNALLEYENSGGVMGNGDLQQASLKLAHNASKYTIEVWLDSLERINYNR